MDQSVAAQLLREWEALNDELSQLYREAARQSAKGYDSYEMRSAMNTLELKEHAAWCAYRDYTYTPPTPES